MTNLRIGIGTDTHRLVENRKLILGGVEIQHNKGCDGHSDGDALIHAICDALLGAANLRDIGYHFPDTDKSNKSKDSTFFLTEVALKLINIGYSIVNIDSSIHIQKPKINPHILEMQNILSEVLNIDKSQISIKAKTGEKIGIIGREEAVSVQVVALIEKTI